MKLTASSLLLLLTVASAFTAHPSPKAAFALRSSAHDSAKEIVDASEAASWQDVWEYDSAMSNTYANHFKVGNWLKSMPCGASLNADCPNELLAPGAVEPQVDVMGFLGIKRPEGVKEGEVVVSKERLKDAKA